MTKKRRRHLDDVKKRWLKKPCDQAKYAKLLEFREAMILDPQLKFVGIEEACAWTPKPKSFLKRLFARLFN